MCRPVFFRRRRTYCAAGHFASHRMHRRPPVRTTTTTAAGHSSRASNIQPLFDAGRGEGEQQQQTCKRPGGVKKKWVGWKSWSVGRSVGWPHGASRPTVGVTKVSEGEGGGCIFFPQLAVINQPSAGRKESDSKKKKKGEKDEGKREKDDRNVPLRFLGVFILFCCCCSMSLAVR